MYIKSRRDEIEIVAIQRQNVIARHQKKTKEDILRFQSAMNSYLGILCHYRTYRLRKRMLFKHLSAWWWNHVYLRGGITMSGSNWANIYPDETSQVVKRPSNKQNPTGQKDSVGFKKDPSMCEAPDGVWINYLVFTSFPVRLMPSGEVIRYI
jgi:hypothetical protein